MKFLLLFLSLFSQQKTGESKWFYPIKNYEKRITVNNFGTLANDKFYVGKEKLYPYNRFSGYHAGVDFEIFGNELNQNVSIFAVTSGKIIYIGNVAGYGGVIIQTLDKTNNTALYGHVKLKNLTLKVNDAVKAGEQITLLGDQFSSETSRERKHLHFAIHKNQNIDLLGYEPDQNSLLENWENPINFLKEKETQ